MIPQKCTKIFFMQLNTTYTPLKEKSVKMGELTSFRVHCICQTPLAADDMFESKDCSLCNETYHKCCVSVLLNGGITKNHPEPAIATQKTPEPARSIQPKIRLFRPTCVWAKNLPGQTSGQLSHLSSALRKSL